jgi:hypothetical protein
MRGALIRACKLCRTPILVTSGHLEFRGYWTGTAPVARMSTIVLRSGVEIDHPLELALEFLEAYSSYEAHDSSGAA